VQLFFLSPSLSAIYRSRLQALRGADLQRSDAYASQIVRLLRDNEIAEQAKRGRNAQIALFPGVFYGNLEGFQPG